MDKRYLTAVTKFKKAIIAAKVDGVEYPSDEIIKHMRNRDEDWNQVFAYCEGYPISKVFPKRNFWGTEFLCTAPDGILENNLGELEEF